MRFARRVRGLGASTIREMLKQSADPEVVPFAAGNPSPETFPAQELQQISEELYTSGRIAEAFQYGITEGYGPLRELTSARLKSVHGVGSDRDSLIITSGGQQGLELAAKALCDEGDTVLCENPSFIGALNAFRSFGLNLRGVPTDGGGMDTDALEHALKTVPNVRLIYTIPTFQNPTGATMTLQRRQKLLELAERYDVLVLEDSPYLELRYSGQSLPPIKSLDGGDRVIYAGSYSKIVAPGLRVGFVCAPSELTQKMTVCKQVSDVHTNSFFQMAVAEFVSRYDLDAHIARCRELYRRKRDVLAAALRERFGDNLLLNLPEGGLFLWLALKGMDDSLPFCLKAKEKKAMAVPGVTFLTDPAATSPGCRLNFSLPDEEHLVRGANLLYDAWEELHS
jgi:2-aminoadipate transaminase